jgi:hypothetical protein
MSGGLGPHWAQHGSAPSLGSPGRRRQDRIPPRAARGTRGVLGRTHCPMVGVRQFQPDIPRGGQEQ